MSGQNFTVLVRLVRRKINESVTTIVSRNKRRREDPSNGRILKGPESSQISEINAMYTVVINLIGLVYSPK